MDQFVSQLPRPRYFKRIIPFVEKWNRNFTMPYWVYRDKLKQIAEKSLLDTGLPVVKRSDVKKGWIVVPIDDDDWLHPQIGERLSLVFGDKEVNCMCWTNAFLWLKTKPLRGKLRRRIEGFKSMSPFRETLSCGYAVRSFFPKRQWFDHLQANEYRKTNPDQTVYKRDCLSVYVRHNGATMMMPYISRQVFLGDFKTPVMPSKLAWAETYVSEVIDLHNGIRNKPFAKHL